MNKKLFIIISACILLSGSFLFILNVYGDAIYDDIHSYAHHSTVKFSVESHEDVEYIIKIEPLGTPKYSADLAIYHDNQEERDRDRFLNLTTKKQVEKEFENELLYKIEVFKTELKKEPEQSFQLHKHVGDHILKEEISVKRNTSHKIKLE